MMMMMMEVTESETVESEIPEKTSLEEKLKNKRKRQYSFEFNDLDENPELRELKQLRVNSSRIPCIVTKAKGQDAPNKTSRCENLEVSQGLCIPNNSIDFCIKRENPEIEEKSVLSASTIGGEIHRRNTDGVTRTDSSESHAAHPGQALERKDDCQVLYVYSQQLIEHCNRLPRILERAGMVHSLIESLGLLKYLKVDPPILVEAEEVMKFHSRDYVEFLQRINCQEDEEEVESDESELYGLTYDCPVQKGVYDCAALVAGATLTAARALCDGLCQVAINWCGGWHHAQRSEASGFCYINDIVLGILHLCSKFSRVLYVDLDLHHGDGVENAFSTTARVLTVSFHKFDAGFFPGTGKIDDVGSRGGKHYCVNVPLKDGICDADFISVFSRVMESVHVAFNPDVVVCQCGADGLTGDPMSSFNLTQAAYLHCLHLLLLWKLPLLLLGGGGYHHANTARCWAFLTALTVGCKLPQDVPDHQHFTDYGPDYEMTVRAGNRKNQNSSQDLTRICNIITENMQKIKGKQL